MLRGAANLSTLYRDRPFLERFGAAAADGFTCVEFWWPAGEDLNAVRAAVRRNALEVTLINVDAGDMASGGRGFFNILERRPQVLESVTRATALATDVGCHLLNALVGNRTADELEPQLAVASDGLRAAAEIAGRSGVRILVEALNAKENPKYLVQSTAQARKLVADTGGAAALQFDAYHMGKVGEDIGALAKELGRRAIAHVQIADDPGRHEPGTGTLPLADFVDALGRAGYSGNIGLEYIPQAGTSDGLRWLREGQWPRLLRFGAG